MTERQIESWREIVFQIVGRKSDSGEVIHKGRVLLWRRREMRLV